MGTENTEDFGSALIMTEEGPQEIGGLINSDGEEVDFSDLGVSAVPGIRTSETPLKTFRPSENEKPPSLHSCSVCGKDFPYASKLQRHLRTHSGERPFPCSMCEKRFPEKGLLMIHERVHTGEKPFPCTFCEKRFASQGELRLHRRTHTGERPYHCSICLKSFSRHWHLKTHLEAMHSEVVAGFTRKKFPCSDCDKSCNSAAELRDHQRTHTGERPYQCSFCDKRFALSGTLVRHERLHTGITPYHCADCGKTFAQQWTLTTHMRTHTGEKPYSCTQCDKSFVAPGELRRHTRIHTGEKPYTCPDCGRHFSLAGTLRNHKRSCTQTKNGSATDLVTDSAAFGESSQQDIVNSISSECLGQASPSDGLNCDKATQYEENSVEPEDGLGNGPSSPHMNVIVKEEEEEEPLGVDEAPAASVSEEDFTTPEKAGEQHRDINREIPMAVKKEEEERVNMDEGPGAPVPAGEDCPVPEKTNQQHQDINTEIPVTLKKEEQECVSMNEAPGAVLSGDEDCTPEEKVEDQHQDMNTEIKITIKEEEEERVNKTMAGRKKKTFTTAEVLDRLTTDSGASIFPLDSSSDEEDLLQPEQAPDSNSDFEIPSTESDKDDDDDYEPYTSTTSASASPGHSSPHADPNPGSLQPWFSSSDSESPEDISPKRKRKASRKFTYSATLTGKEEEGEERWHKKEEKDKIPDPVEFMPARNPGPTFDTTASWSPLSLFQLFFNTSVVRTLIDNTNANAVKRLKAGQMFVWKKLTVKDFYIFMSIIIFSGLVKVHHRSDYWKREWPYNFHFPREKMTRARFEAILWSLHLSNPNEDEENDRKKDTGGYDRLFKIKPLYTDIVSACRTHFQPYRNISINERIVASKARIGFKQHMKDKPMKWGYKLFVLTDASTAYAWNFFVYTGRSEVNPAHGLGYSSVMDLISLPLLGQGYTLFVDSFYTSPALFKDLSNKNITCCGTIRKHKEGFPKTEVNDFPKKAERGDLRWIRRDSLLFLKWIDTHEVTMCSTVHEAFSGQSVKRKVKEDGVWQTKNVLIPDAVVAYNESMGGVNVSDALNGCYSVHHKTMKWYKTFFYHFVDIAVVNSFLLHKELCKMRNDPTRKPYTHKSFREQLTDEMMQFAEGLAPPTTTPPPPPTTCMPLYFGADATRTRRYCKRCQDAGIKRMKTPVYCRKCQVPLCLTSKKNCFQEWHDAHNMPGENPDHAGNGGKDSPPASPVQLQPHNNVTKSSYCCGLCGRDCHKMSALQIHMRIHSGEKPYQCTLCGKQFTQKGQLKGHLKVHTGEKPFSCPDCGKSFAHSGAMNRHRLTHTGERPYHCSVCDRSFNQSGRLREHEKIHFGEKFDCPECEKSFTRASSLKNHFRLHTGERPYGCDICGRGFSRSQSLRLHKRKHGLIQTEESSGYSVKDDDLSQGDNDSPINMCITDKND